MANQRRSWIQRLLRTPESDFSKSWLRSIVSGSLYKISDIKTDSVISNIKSQIDTMRALANDSQVSTALSYYATDSTVVNTAGQIIWATTKDGKPKEAGEIVNSLFKRWDINAYARDHILELATIGNLYIPTTMMMKQDSSFVTTQKIAINNNTIPDADFDILPCYKIPPEDILHVYKCGEAAGFLYQPDENSSETEIFPEGAAIHFSLGGLLGDYTIDVPISSGEVDTYDIKFATPLLAAAVQPTQILNLLEDALILSSLIRTVKFVNVECGDAEETEVQTILEDIKACIEQQLSLNTRTGDAQSFMNPQSPNNLIYLPRISGQDAISITDLNMSDATAEDNKLLEYYQDKKLSVLGVPKEAMNFSATEGLGGAGSVLSQRSAIYANILQRIKTAYMSGWRDGLNRYFIERGMSGLVDSFELHMAEIITTQSTVTFEKRDAALSQATTLVQMLKDIGVDDPDMYKDAIAEILTEVLPLTGGRVSDWNLNLDEGGEGGAEGAF